MLTPREKSPLPENVPRGGSNLRHRGQRAHALPTELFRPLIVCLPSNQHAVQTHPHCSRDSHRHICQVTGVLCRHTDGRQGRADCVFCFVVTDKIDRHRLSTFFKQTSMLILLSWPTVKVTVQKHHCCYHHHYYYYYYQFYCCYHHHPYYYYWCSCYYYYYYHHHHHQKCYYHYHHH